MGTEVTTTRELRSGSGHASANAGFTISGVLRHCWMALSNRFWLIIGLNVVLLLAMVGLFFSMLWFQPNLNSVWRIASSILPGGWSFPWHTAFDLYVGLLFLGAMQASSTWAISSFRWGSRARFGQCLLWGIRRGLPSSVALILVSVPIGVVLTGLWRLPEFVFTGLIFILMSPIVVFIPVCTMEQLGPFSCIRRAYRLSSDYRLQIVALLLMLVGIIELWTLIIQVLPFRVPRPDGIFGTVILLGIRFAKMLILPVLLNVLIATVYVDLRQSKEGAVLADVSGVFD